MLGVLPPTLVAAMLTEVKIMDRLLIFIHLLIPINVFILNNSNHQIYCSDFLGFNSNATFLGPVELGFKWKQNMVPQMILPPHPIFSILLLSPLLRLVEIGFG